MKFPRKLLQHPARFLRRKNLAETIFHARDAPGLGMAQVAFQFEQAGSIGGEFGVTRGLANRFLDHFHRTRDFLLRRAGNNKVVRFRRIPGAPPGANRRPKPRMVQVTDGNASVAHRHRILSAARRDGIVRGHLARGGKLHRGRPVDSEFFQNRPECRESCGQADFRMAIAGGDSGQRALRARQEPRRHLPRKLADRRRGLATKTNTPSDPLPGRRVDAYASPASDLQTGRRWPRVRSETSTVKVGPNSRQSHPPPGNKGPLRGVLLSEPAYARRLEKLRVANSVCKRARASSVSFPLAATESTCSASAEISSGLGCTAFP